MNDCIIKPFTQQDLFNSLNKHLGRKVAPKKENGAKESKPDTLVDLSYLRKMSNNNQDFIDEIIGTFLESMPGNINEITQSAASGNWEQVAKIVHKIKPTITLMGIHSLKDKIVTLEQEAKNNPGSPQATTLAQEVSASLNQVVESLRKKV